MVVGTGNGQQQQNLEPNIRSAAAKLTQELMNTAQHNNHQPAASPAAAASPRPSQATVPPLRIRITPTAVVSGSSGLSASSPTAEANTRSTAATSAGGELKKRWAAVAPIQRQKHGAEEQQQQQAVTILGHGLQQQQQPLVVAKRARLLCPYCPKTFSHQYLSTHIHIVHGIRQQPVDAPEKQICGQQPAAGIEPQSSRMGRGRYKKGAGDAAAADEPGDGDIADVVRQNVLKILKSASADQRCGQQPGDASAIRKQSLLDLEARLNKAFPPDAAQHNNSPNATEPVANNSPAATVAGGQHHHHVVDTVLQHYAAGHNPSIGRQTAQSRARYQQQQAECSSTASSSSSSDHRQRQQPQTPQSLAFMQQPCIPSFSTQDSNNQTMPSPSIDSQSCSASSSCTSHSALSYANTATAHDLVMKKVKEEEDDDDIQEIFPEQQKMVRQPLIVDTDRQVNTSSNIFEQLRQAELEIARLKAAKEKADVAKEEAEERAQMAEMQVKMVQMEAKLGKLRKE